jgi:hypothetical protein
MTTSPSPDAWPFLITRSRSVGQRTVLAPAFLTSSRRHGLLKSAVARPEPTTLDLLRKSLHIEPEGDYTLFFRTVIAHPNMIGLGGDVLLDESSRTVEVTEGIMITGEVSEPDPGSVAEALRVIAETFRAFWLADNRNASPVEAPAILPGKTAVVDLASLRPTPRLAAPQPPPVSAARVSDTEGDKPASPIEAPHGRRSASHIPWWAWLRRLRNRRRTDRGPVDAKFWR